MTAYRDSADHVPRRCGECGYFRNGAPALDYEACGHVSLVALGLGPANENERPPDTCPLRGDP